MRRFLTLSILACAILGAGAAAEARQAAEPDRDSLLAPGFLAPAGAQGDGTAALHAAEHAFTTARAHGG